MPLRYSGAVSIVAAIIAIALAWMLLLLAGPETPVVSPAPGILVLAPARAALAFYGFLVLAASLPALYLAAALWLPGRPLDQAVLLAQQSGRRVWSGWRGAYTALFVLALCGAAVVAGYACETVRSQVRLTSSGLEYRASSQTARVAWQDVRGMVLRLRGRDQTLIVQSATGKATRIDLAIFSSASTSLLLQTLKDRAALMPEAGNGRDYGVWSRPVRQEPAQ